MEEEEEEENNSSPSSSSPIHHLPQDTLHQIFSTLPIRDILISRSISKFFNQTLTSPSFLHLISLRPPLNFIALRPPHRHHHHHRHHNNSSSSSSSPPPLPFLYVFDPDSEPNLNQWLKFPFDFIPFKNPVPVASSLGLVYLWADSSSTITTTTTSSSSSPSPHSNKTLILCNPLTRRFQVLPPLGSAWSRHGTVLVGPPNRVLVLTELAALYYSGNLSGGGSNSCWLKFSSNLSTKPRSPILVGDSLFALCDIGSPWRSQWKLFTCTLKTIEKSPQHGLCWNQLERHEWGDVFDILKRPRLIKGCGNRILMIGGLRSSFSLNASCFTILILRLDLDTLEWDEAGRMPSDMFQSCFHESSKFKVFGGGDRVCFSGKKVRRLAMWDCSKDEPKMGEWRWVDGVPGNGDGSLYRGFVFEARLTALP